MMVEPFEVQAKTTKSGHLPLHKCEESKENKYFLQISNIMFVLLTYLKFIMQEMILKAQHFCAVHSMYILCLHSNMNIMMHLVVVQHWSEGGL